jgi:2-polyprenyl-3-methyl-5-hydroxy-6-metoxy-1,4-benzoquinol methylase
MTNHIVSTINDFGRQWEKYTENTGYYASTASLVALFGPLLFPSYIKGKQVSDIGAGTGRYCRILSELGAREILAVEPSTAFDILKKNTNTCQGIQYLQATAEQIPSNAFDLIFCIGVLQFIKDPMPALRAMGRALNTEGKLFFMGRCWRFSSVSDHHVQPIPRTLSPADVSRFQVSQLHALFPQTGRLSDATH